MSALMLASAYAAGAYYFARAAVSRRWHHISHGFLPVLAFATLMGVVTVVHWPLFIHANIAFKLWAALYFVTPFLVAGAWWVNRREDGGGADEDDVTLPEGLRRFSAGLGVLGLLTAGPLLIVPGPLIDLWAWPLTPLTARVICVIFVLFSAYLVAVSTDPRWSAARLTVESLIVGLLFIVIGVARTRGTFLWSRPSAWLFVVGTGAALVAAAWLLTFGGRLRARSAGASISVDTTA
jgi:hypothetical protein